MAVFSTDLYCGKGTNLDKKLGLGGNVVKSFVKLVEYHRPHEFYFDNFFTSVEILNHLSSLNIKATGTARQNRTLKCPFTCDTVFKKEARGFFETYTANKVVLVKRNDTTSVIIGTNFDQIEPIKNTIRYSKGSKIDIYSNAKRCRQL